MGISSLTKSPDLMSENLHMITDEELIQLHNVLIEITNDIAQICTEHNISWSLSGGSILGAVRHKGFIPWDDDIDLFMSREALEKFKKVFPGKYEDKYELKIPGDKNYLYHFPKIYKKNTTAQEIQSSDTEKGCVSIDIFVLENTFDNIFLRTLHGIICTVFLFIDSVVRMKECQNNLLKYGHKNKELCNAVKKRVFFAKFFSFFNIEKWLSLSDIFFSMCKNSNTNNVVVPSGTCHFFGEIYDRKKISETILTDFENEKFYIPKNFDYYLTIRYGADYMIPPSEDKKEHHMFIKFDLNN